MSWASSSGMTVSLTVPNGHRHGGAVDVLTYPKVFRSGPG